jgi:hypothetical protein
VIAPISLELGQVRELRAEMPEAIYESLKQTLRVELPEDPAERLAAVRRVAGALTGVVPAAA